MWKLFLFFSDIWTFYMRKFEFWTRKVYIRLRKSVKDVVKEGDAVTFFLDASGDFVCLRNMIHCVHCWF